ncbi:MAG: hypothetical protein AAB557_03275 [Patescibacteria group bacterium]
MNRIWSYVMNAIVYRSMYRGKIVTFLEQNKQVILVSLVGAIFIDSIFLKTSSDVITFGVLAAYGIYAKMTHITSKLTFLLCLLFLTALGISFFSSSASVTTEKFSVWLFLFMIVGIIQELRT